LGWSNTYDPEFQPVSLWSRGNNKLAWIKKSEDWKNDLDYFKQIMKITWVGWIIEVFSPALLLVVLPPATRGVVAYFTLPRGLGCRSLSFIVYTFCRMMITIIATIHGVIDSGEEGCGRRGSFRERSPVCHLR